MPFIILIFPISYIACQSTKQYLIIPCRMLQQIDTGNFSNCQKISGCIDQPPPSAFDKCKQYGFVQVTNTQCRSLCCPTLEQGDIEFTSDEVTQCIDAWNLKQVRYILGVIFGCLGAAMLLLALGALRVYGFTKNPYTGKKVWTGVLCCRKQVDFREQYQAGVSHKNLNKQIQGPMIMDPNAAP